MARVHFPPPRRRHPWRRFVAVGGVVAVLIIAFVLWSYASDEPAGMPVGSPAAEVTPVAAADPAPVPSASADEPLELGAKPARQDGKPSGDQTQRIQTALDAGRQALEKDDPLAAQVQLTAALRAGAAGEQADELRAKLVQLANQVVFSPARRSGDPHTATYVVKRGDNLRKIAKQFKTTADLIARINNLSNKSMIREGARLKVARGPFHAVVHKRQHALDVFLDDILVRTYQVGLGEHNSTPTGVWCVKNKLTNPTYFPPRGGKIVHADDPENPLGEHWLGLEGVGGEAKDQLRYGIHGTNEPDSIGKSLSLGCIRMHNRDVSELYTLLVLKHSKVTVVE